MLDPQLVAAAIVAVEVNAEILRGVQGEEGPEGPKGDKGDPGPQGATGQKGDKGDDGVTGPEGPQGKRGQRGPQGERGLQGTKGDKGERGPAGAGNMFPRPAGGGGGSGSGSALTVKDEGVNLDTAVTSLDFTGAGVTATAVGHAVTVDITSSGSGAPFPPWTEGGHGDVVATTDDGSTPLIVTLESTGGSGAGTLIVETGDLPSDTVDVLRVRQTVAAGNAQIMSIDSSGEMDLFILDPLSRGLRIEQALDGALLPLLHVFGGSFGGSDPRDADWLIQFVEGGLTAVQKLLYFGHAGFKLGGMNAAPDDADLDANEVGFWFDDTNGAASPKWKGKQADGTVVSGSMGGSTTSFVSIAKWGTD